VLSDIEIEFGTGFGTIVIEASTELINRSIINGTLTTAMFDLAAFLFLFYFYFFFTFLNKMCAQPSCEINAIYLQNVPLKALNRRGKRRKEFRHRHKAI